MKAIITVILLLQFIQAKTQINTVKINCPDNLGFVTNEGVTKACEFYFENENPNIFFVENFRHVDFHELINKDNRKVISRVKLVASDYVAKAYDFIFAYNKDNVLLFYYILKNEQEEKLFEQ